MSSWGIAASGSRSPRPCRIASTRSATSVPTAEEAAPADPALFGTSWVAQAAVDDDVLTVPTRPEASASFTLDGNGGIAGTYGCDQFSGPAAVSGNTLTVGTLEIPLIFCIIGNSVLAGALSEVFEGPATYVVRNDLLYLSREGGPVVILQARPASPTTSPATS